MNYQIMTTLVAEASPLKFGLIELNWTFIFQIINTIIMFMVLRMLLFKPVTQFLEKRQEGIANAISEADQKNTEAEQLIISYNKKLQEAHLESSRIVKEAEQDAKGKAEAILRNADSEVKKMKEKALLEIDREKEKAMNELREEISELAILVASKVIDRDLDKEKHSELIEGVINQLGGTKWQS
jgi:F-type H+-transporting ATPase subunit b